LFFFPQTKQQIKEIKKADNIQLLNNIEESIRSPQTEAKEEPLRQVQM